MYKETHLRSILKSVSWRLSGTLVTAIVVFYFTSKISVALTVGGIEAVSKIVLYFFHERLWDNIKVGKKSTEPMVLWFTGLSGAGKSTIADQVYEKMKKRGLRVERLDGDAIRDIFPATGFTREDRENHVKRVGYLASKLESNGIFVVCSFISPFQQSRDFVRKLCKNFVEIHVATPLEECEKRDVKGLYAKARRGEIKNFTGISDPYEAPPTPEIFIDTKSTSLHDAVSKVMRYIKRNI